jgi:hypothetical protein
MTTLGAHLLRTASGQFSPDLRWRSTAGSERARFWRRCASLPPSATGYSWARPDGLRLGATATGSIPAACWPTWWLNPASRIAHPRPTPVRPTCRRGRSTTSSIFIPGGQGHGSDQKFAATSDPRATSNGAAPGHVLPVEGHRRRSAYSTTRSSPSPGGEADGREPAAGFNRFRRPGTSRTSRPASINSGSSPSWCSVCPNEDPKKVLGGQ